MRRSFQNEAEGRRNYDRKRKTDATVAAATLKFDVPLVTHNRTHFEDVTGLTIISETT